MEVSFFPFEMIFRCSSRSLPRMGVCGLALNRHQGLRFIHLMPELIPNTQDIKAQGLTANNTWIYLFL